ncbi:MAG: sigma-54 dependent transcriptional regulator [Tepidimonas sp.]|uniref:sigma-54-dependent transcriptional regulator n=1 Tax=Tepidimonas sp. TaxID=2002775 RepID=UPI00298F09AC|nr:sigma-54 dependent transcriptional regulator [Tepidimonas sp.]MDW8335775.1 sigma-54 dependent transcriptional regulator [Tepidimonas sp.]
MSAPSLLIVEDEPDLRQLYALALARVGQQVDEAADLASARAHLAKRPYSVVVLDMRLPDGSGLELLQELAGTGRGERVIVVTAYGSADNAVQALKAGAFDYLSKPVSPARLRQAIAAALQAHAPPAVATPAAPTPPANPDALQRLIGDSAAMQAVRATITRVARTMAPVLISGESGTGKELIARALHACSHRASGPFVAVNCGAIPAELLESELFGHKRGAFTGATSDRPGLFQAAHGGTLFLDEVAELPLPLQVKLLRVLQERAVRPVGALTEEPVDVRIVSATHKDLAALVHEGRFRHDLYYRLNVIPIQAPALREHPEDLPAIAQAILQRLALREGLPAPPRLSEAALQRLRQHLFPGNVRELENLLERALALHPGTELQAEAIELPAPSRNHRESAPLPATADDDTPLTRAELQTLLERNRWNQSRTARELGWTLAKLRYWMQRLGVN